MSKFAMLVAAWSVRLRRRASGMPSSSMAPTLIENSLLSGMGISDVSYWATAPIKRSRMEAATIKLQKPPM